MYFLGQAANYKGLKTWKHFFAFGTKDDSEELRAYLAAHYGTTKDHVALYHNGRSALAVAMRKLLPQGSEVIITALTCSAVVQAVRAAKCVPVYADIDMEKLHFGPEELIKAIKTHDNVSAVIVQNNLGIPCDIEIIEKICKRKKLVLIEDLAHCAGVFYEDGREVGTVGRVTCLSFGKGKSIDTISGGAVVFRNEEDEPPKQPEKRPKLGESMRDRWYPVFAGQIRTLYYIGLGKFLTAFLIKIGCIERSADSRLATNTRLTHWQAKLALKQLKSLPRNGREPIRDYYLVKHRKELLHKLEKYGYVFNDIWYDTPVAPARYYKKSKFHEDECPVATAVSKHIINIPTHYAKSDLVTAYNIIKEYKIDD